MGDSNGKSRRGLLAALAVLVVGFAQFGADILRALVRVRHPLRALRHSDDESEERPDRDSGSIDGDRGIDTDEILEQHDRLFWNVDTEITVDMYGYNYWGVDIVERNMQEPILIYDILVRDGPNIDFFILEEKEFEAFQQGDNFRYLITSETGIWNASGRSRLERKKYYFVIDNSNRGPTSPEDFEQSDARVSIEMSLDEANS